MSVRGYSTVLHARGAPTLAVAFLALGIADTMTPVAFVLFARSSTHSFAIDDSGIAATAVLSFVGAVAFAAPQAARREPKPAKPGRLPALAGGGIRTVVATSAGDLVACP